MLGPDPYDLPKTDPSPTPTEPNPSTASGGQLAWLGFGLSLGFFCFALPAWLLVWLASTVLGTFGIAELLEQTRGLAPTTYGGAFWLAAAFTALMVLVELFAIFGPKEERPGCLVAILTKPSLALFFLAFPTLVLVKVDLGGTDVPDILTTFLLLVSLGYIFAILPIALFALCSRITRSLWRIGKASGFRSGIFGTLGIALAALMPLVCAVGAPDDDSPTGKVIARSGHLVTTALEAAESRDLLDGSRDALVAISEEIGRPTSTLARSQRQVVGDRGRFDDCVDTLSRSTTGAPPLLEARWTLQKRYRIDKSLAEDIAAQKLLHVCLKHSQSAVRNLVPYFIKAAKNETLKQITRDRAHRDCLRDLGRGSYSASSDPYRGRDDFADFRQAFCKLSNKDQDILRMSADGETSNEIASKVGLTSSAVRKRKERRLDDLRRALGRN